MSKNLFNVLTSRLREERLSEPKSNWRDQLNGQEDEGVSFSFDYEMIEEIFEAYFVVFHLMLRDARGKDKQLAEFSGLPENTEFKSDEKLQDDEYLLIKVRECVTEAMVRFSSSLREIFDINMDECLKESQTQTLLSVAGDYFSIDKTLKEILKVTQKRQTTNTSKRWNIYVSPGRPSEWSMEDINELKTLFYASRIRLRAARKFCRKIGNTIYWFRHLKTEYPEFSDDILQLVPAGDKHPTPSELALMVAGEYFGTDSYRYLYRLIKSKN